MLFLATTNENAYSFQSALCLASFPSSWISHTKSVRAVGEEFIIPLAFFVSQIKY